LEITLNAAIRRRYSWISLIVAAAVFVGAAQSLVAQSAPGQPAPAAPGAPGQLKTLVVVAGAKYEKLIADITFLGPYLGQPAAGPMAEMALAGLTQGKSATALDKTKPWGIIVQTDDAKPSFVVCLPVANADDVIDIAKAHQAAVKDSENGTKELSLPNAPPVFLKAESGVVFLSTAQSSLAKLPANALDILGKRVGDDDLSVSLAVKNIPDMYRQIPLGWLQAKMQEKLQKSPGETDEQFAQKQQMAEENLKQVTQLINEIDTVKVAWAIDPQEKRTFVDFTYQFIAGSKLAQPLAAYTQPSTNFSGFNQPGAAATGMVAIALDPKSGADALARIESAIHGLGQELERQIDKKHQGASAEDREALKAVAHDAFDAIVATVKEGQLDGGASMQMIPGASTFIAGVHVKEPAKIESALKKLEAVAKKSPGLPEVKWNVADHAGVKFHTLTVPLPEGKKGPRIMYGENLDIAVGIGADAVYVGLGKDNIALLEKAIDASTADRKAVSPFAVSVSLGPVMALAAEGKEGQEKAALQKLAQKLNGEAKGRDHIRVTGSVVQNGLNTRLEAEEGVLQTIGAATMMKQQARQPRPPAPGN
jgi:hypothetical protein